MFTADTLMNRNHSKASFRGRFGSPGDSAKPSQCDQYRANNPPMWFLLLCGCCEYFRITRWSIPEGRLVNDVEPLLHRQSTERWAESDFRTFLSLKTWAVSIKCLSPKGTSEEAVSKKKKKLLGFFDYTEDKTWEYAREGRVKEEKHCGWGELITLLPAMVGLLRASSSVKSQRSKQSVNTCLWSALAWTYAQCCV